MKMDKKGAELSMNVVIISLIAVLVLVVVAIVFTGNVSNAVNRMKAILNIGAEGKDLELFKLTCTQLCDEAKLDAKPESSGYCTRTASIEENGLRVVYACTDQNKEDRGKYTNSVGVECGVSC